jgi:RNA polymerase subunit RPABC4/transcription elongation factor Spt4
MSLLPAVDRVCLAITCKALAASAINSPYLRAGGWTPWDRSAIEDFPSRNQLIQRLAHGWIDKSRLRYCQTCHKILPRDSSQYWWDKLCKKKNIPWDVKVRLEKEKWKKLSKKKRFEHIIKSWCEAEGEDSSVFSCRLCVRTRILGLDNSRGRDVEKATPQQSDLRAIPQVPVECPVCVEHSLTNRWKEPRKPKVRPFLWKWTKKTLSFCGNVILVLIYLLYLLLKAPVELGIWIWKKYKGNKPNFRRAIQMLCTGKQGT